MEEGYGASRHIFEVVTSLEVRGDLNRVKVIEKNVDGQDLDCSSNLWETDKLLSDSSDVEGDSTSGCDAYSFQNDCEHQIPHGLEGNLSHIVNCDVHEVSVLASNHRFVASRIESGQETASFLVTNLSTIIQQWHLWKELLPMVEPFYAVKCNPDPVILRLLASLGSSFDCATMGEIDLVLNGLGSDCQLNRNPNFAASSIVYANPAKMPHMLSFAQQSGVRMTVFDGEDELYKIASLPKDGKDGFQLLLRLTTDDRASVCRFSKKFGCPVDEAKHLLEVAKFLGLDVAGVSFHVGSGCGDAAAYRIALEHSMRVFDEAAELGFPPLHIVDLGGGFPGEIAGHSNINHGRSDMPTFPMLAKVIRQELAVFEERYGAGNVRFIAEPGRYFVSASTVIATKIYARKGGRSDYQALYVDDGVYGSFNNVVYDHFNPSPEKLKLSVSSSSLKKRSVLCCGGMTDDESADSESDGDDASLIPSAVFGPTCDGLDQLCALENTQLPRCDVGDWLVWENMGAYTHTASFIFNGYTHFPKKTYCRSV